MERARANHGAGSKALDGMSVSTPTPNRGGCRVSSLDVTRAVLAVTCVVLPLAVRHGAAVITLAVLSGTLLAQRWFPNGTVLGGAALVAELAVALHRDHSGIDLLTTATAGLLLLAISGLTHATGHREPLVRDLVAATPGIGIAGVAMLVVPPLGDAGLLAGCLAAGGLIIITAGRSAVPRGRPDTLIDHKETSTSD